MILREITSSEITRFENFARNSFIKTLLTFNFYKRLPAKIKNFVLNNKADFIVKNCNFLVYEEGGVVFSWAAFIECESDIFLYFCYTKMPFRNRGLMRGIINELSKREKKISFCVEKNISKYKIFSNMEYRAGCL